MTFTAKVSNSRPVTRFQWGAAAKAWADQVEPLVVSALRAKAPARTEHLRKSIRGDRRVSAARAVLTFTAVDYASFVIHGTAAHEIRPRVKQALWWEGAAHPVAQVHHPGTHPNDFVRRAIEPLRPLIQSALDEVVAAQFKS